MNEKEKWMISPTGLGVRALDKWGDGRYGAPRGGRRHKGVDFICIPNQEIVSPINGLFIRLKFPYANPVNGILFGGVLLRGSNFDVTMFYFEPIKGKIAMPVKKGEVLGLAQDLRIKYDGITPHIHLQIDSINPELFINLP